MSPATHTLVGVWGGTIACQLFPDAVPSSSQWLVPIVAGLAGNAPDVDTIFPMLFSKSYRRAHPLLDHRGLMHSVWMLPVFGGLCALMVNGVECSFARFTSLTLIFSLLAASHLLLDMIDGSDGIFAFAGLWNVQLRFSVALVNDVEFEDDADRAKRRASWSELRQRVWSEALFALMPCYGLFVVFRWLL